MRQTLPGLAETNGITGNFVADQAEFSQGGPREAHPRLTYIPQAQGLSNVARPLGQKTNLAEQKRSVDTNFTHLGGI